VVAVTPEDVLDLSALANTSSALLELPDAVGQVRACLASGQTPRLASTAQALANSDETQRQSDQPWFMAPCDLQAVKAAGVTFVASMLERVIEEQARGDASRAEAVRQAAAAGPSAA
jgi:fumarylacetoacetate (FAA) hydrolase family protein